MDAPLFELASRSGHEFANLFEARAESERRLGRRREALSDLGPDDDAAVIFMGSLGRYEATEGSDDDFMLLVDRRKVDESHTSVEIGQVTEKIKAIPGAKLPSDRGIFGNPVHLRDLTNNIGLTADDNSNTTRRMLFLLESTWAFGEDCYLRSVESMFSEYLGNRSIKDRHPPRFMLNDIVRYWRTMGVDFAGKEREGPEKWGIRNAKLRTSRKVLFAGGLLPILECAKFDKERIREFLPEQFALTPTDRIAASFMSNDLIDEGMRTLAAYDRFIGLLKVKGNREELERMDRAAAEKSPLFAEIRLIGRQMQDGLVALVFESKGLRDATREYAVF